MDAIASALGYAWLLGQTGDDKVVAARAGQVGAQAAFALGYFGTRPPRVLSSAAPTFGHVASAQEPVTPDALLGEAMSRLAQGERLVPVVDGEGRLLGGLTPLALARAYTQVAGGLARASEQTCRAYVEDLPTVPAGDRIRDRRGTMLRGGGEEFLVVGENGRYLGTANPNFQGGSFQNNNIIAMLQLQMKFGAPTQAVAAAPAPSAPQAPSFMVFFDWDRSELSPQAVNTIRQAAGSYKTKGSARITATGHTDKSGPDDYNMALSLRRANTVKDALVREGVPATAISVLGRGEQQPLVATADGVREPQNRRVEIVVQ